MKRSTKVLIITLLASSGLGLTMFIVSMILEKSFGFYAIVTLTLTLLLLLAALSLLLVTKIVSREPEEAPIGDDATVICPNCNHENPPKSPYCHHCGAPLK